MALKSPTINKFRGWLNGKLLRLVMWLTDGIECVSVGTNVVNCEARHHRTRALTSPPTETEMRPGDVFLYIGDWAENGN